MTHIQADQQEHDTHTGRSTWHTYRQINKNMTHIQADRQEHDTHTGRSTRTWHTYRQIDKNMTHIQADRQEHDTPLHNMITRERLSSFIRLLYCTGTMTQARQQWPQLTWLTWLYMYKCESYSGTCTNVNPTVYMYKCESYSGTCTNVNRTVVHGCHFLPSLQSAWLNSHALARCSKYTVPTPVDKNMITRERLSSFLPPPTHAQLASRKMTVLFA